LVVIVAALQKAFGDAIRGRVGIYTATALCFWSMQPHSPFLKSNVPTQAPTSKLR
jgi:hypothetical protein